MRKHTELPWIAMGNMVYRHTPDGCLAVAQGPEAKTEAGRQLIKTNMAFIAQACNKYYDLIEQRDALLAACKLAVEPLSEGGECGLPAITYNLVCRAIVKATD